MTSTRRALLGALASTLPLVAADNLVNDVRAQLARGEFISAGRQVAEYRKRAGASVEVAEATSWLGRAALAAKDYDRAVGYAADARAVSLELLKTRKLDDEKHLPLALGASIEVNAQALAGRGERDAAVAFLRGELERWRATSIHERIQKNINLLSLEGKPAPPLRAAKWLGGAPKPLASLRGKTVLLFLWAHWCGDCKGMVPAVAAVARDYASRGLVVVGPTKLYGYAAGGMDAPSSEEMLYIDQVRKKYYGEVTGMTVPVGREIFRTYGVSTTPTLVLIDRTGTVRLYHPGAMTLSELGGRVEALLAR